MQPDTFERDGKPDAVGMDVVGLRRSGGGLVCMLQTVRRLMERRRDERAAEEGDEREASSDGSEAWTHGVGRTTQR